jgi:DNA-binding NtrC family response regulator
MGYRFQEPGKKGTTAANRVIRMTITRGDAAATGDARDVVLTVGNDWETLNFVNDNMDHIATNLVRMTKMNAQRQMHVEESAQLFERNLQPLFTLISATTSEHVMDKLSNSLKKALLLMAMDRYSCDSDSICRALGISRVKLEKELKRCGLSRQESQAA